MLRKKIKNFLMLEAHAMGRSMAVDPLQKYSFRVIIPGLPALRFQKVNGLKIEATVTEYSEGGAPTKKLPGRLKVDPITLERGVYTDVDFAKEVKRALTDPNIRQTFTIEHLDRKGTPAKTYKLAEAWINSWEGSDLDGTSDDVAIEKITVQFEEYL